jgi:S-formylglutathione hydrolase FrmB
MKRAELRWLNMNSKAKCGILFVAAAIAVNAFAAAENKVVFAEIESAALGGRKLPIAVVVPENSMRAERSVLFFLHGRGRNHRSLLDSPAARAALLAAPFYVVLPQGEDGWYIDSPALPADRYGAYMDEVLAWTQRKFPVARVAGGRGIAGWSMGGYGAVRVAQTRPGQFGFVASIIGLLDFPRPETLPDGQNYQVPVQRFTADPKIWEAYNPLRAVEALRGIEVTLVLASHGFERTMNENFVAELDAKSIRPVIHRLEGGHEFSVVERAVPIVLADAEKFFRRAANSK